MGEVKVRRRLFHAGVTEQADDLAALERAPRVRGRCGIAARWKYHVNTVPSSVRHSDELAAAIGGWSFSARSRRPLRAPRGPARPRARRPDRRRSGRCGTPTGSLTRPHGAEHPRIGARHPPHRPGQRMNPRRRAQRRQKAGLRRWPLGAEPARRQRGRPRRPRRGQGRRRGVRDPPVTGRPPMRRQEGAGQDDDQGSLSRAPPSLRPPRPPVLTHDLPNAGRRAEHHRRPCVDMDVARRPAASRRKRHRGRGRGTSKAPLAIDHGGLTAPQRRTPTSCLW